MYTYKLTPEQYIKLRSQGYSLKEIEAQVKKDISGAKTLKICFSETEAAEWLQKKHPRKLTINEVYDWWVENAKMEYTNPSMSGLYQEYERLRAMGKPLIMYKEMAKDNKTHKIY